MSVSALGFAQEHVTSIGTEEQEGTKTPATALSPMPLSPLHTLQADDSLHLPVLNEYGQIPPRYYYYPYAFNRWNSWELHKGLNVSLGASVFAQFGKHAYHGAGFSQNISAMYALPVTNRLSLAIGGYFNHISWMHRSFKDAGISAATAPIRYSRSGTCTTSPAETSSTRKYVSETGAGASFLRCAAASGISSKAAAQMR